MAAISALALLAAGAVAGRWSATRDQQRRYDISVLLTLEVTAEQKRAVGAALGGISPDTGFIVDGVTFETRAHAWAHLQELFKDEPDLTRSVTPDTLPEAFRLKLIGPPDFDCAILRPAMRLPGADDIVIIRNRHGSNYGYGIKCVEFEAGRPG